MVNIVELSLILFLWLMLSKPIYQKYFGWPMCPSWRSLEDVISWVKLWAKVMGAINLRWHWVQSGQFGEDCGRADNCTQRSYLSCKNPKSASRLQAQTVSWRIKMFFASTQANLIGELMLICICSWRVGSLWGVCLCCNSFNLLGNTWPPKTLPHCTTPFASML